MKALLRWLSKIEIGLSRPVVAGGKVISFHSPLRILCLTHQVVRINATPLLRFREPRGQLYRMALNKST
jgi:hypothetical protein